MTMRRKLAACFLGAVLVLSGTGSSCGSTAPAQPSGVEFDDFICEKDDHPNEPECRNQVKPSPKSSPAKPASRTTKKN